MLIRPLHVNLSTSRRWIFMYIHTCTYNLELSLRSHCKMMVNRESLRSLIIYTIIF